ncbi:MAG: hypothetical protein HFG68_03850 [Hungatella sp.]|nr:hypothetical protein [Hungatella sp.]
MSNKECANQNCPCISILCALKLNDPTRYNTLLKRISGITNTMLASSL